MDLFGKPTSNTHSARAMATDVDLPSINVLLEQAAEGLKTLEREYAESVRVLKPTPAFRVGTLNHLVQHRAILDYLANSLVEFCTRAPEKVYFPIAKPGMEASMFQQLVEKRWLPGRACQLPVQMSSRCWNRFSDTDPETTGSPHSQT